MRLSIKKVKVEVKVKVKVKYSFIGNGYEARFGYRLNRSALNFDQAFSLMCSSIGYDSFVDKLL